MGTAVALAGPDDVAVGAGVLVAVGRETAVNFESDALLSSVGCRAAIKAGVGCRWTCSRSVWAVSRAIITARITPLVMSKLLRQF